MLNDLIKFYNEYYNDGDDIKANNINPLLLAVAFGAVKYNDNINGWWSSIAAEISKALFKNDIKTAFKIVMVVNLGELFVFDVNHPLIYFYY